VSLDLQGSDEHSPDIVLILHDENAGGGGF
jgi:hypothetical protein